MINLCVCGDPKCSIKYGECHCGCGSATKIETQTRKIPGHIKGKPVKFKNGHWIGSGRRIDFSDAAPFKIDGMYCKIIQLTKGQYTIVWESDHKWLTTMRWSAAWNKSTKSFYAVTNIAVDDEYRSERMHRMILGLKSNDPLEGDHANNATLDNRRTNIRTANKFQSSNNRRRRKDNESGFKGVSWHDTMKKWRVRISVDGIPLHVGWFDTLQDGHDAYRSAADKFHKNYANHGRLVVSSAGSDEEKQFAAGELSAILDVQDGEE